MDTETFDLQAFIFFAENWKTDSSDISASCAHNAKVCDKMGHAQVANNWLFLSTLFYESTGKESAIGVITKRSNSLNSLNILMSIIHFYAETCNSQMCITLHLLFNGVSQFKKVCEDKVRVWYDSYLGIVMIH